MSNRFINFLLLFLPAWSLIAQNQEDWIELIEKAPVEKLYIHTDREIYLPGETLWLKSYLADSRSGRLLPGTENVYIQLIQEQGKPVLSINLLSLNGQAPGQIELPDTIPPGNYLLNAYTDYLKNFGSDTYFYKTLTVVRPGRSGTRTYQDSASDLTASISFLPEGGKLLEGISNLMAFKAVGKNGYSMDVSGSVKDESGNQVTSFKSDYKGMGIFFFTPKKGKSYHAEVDGMPSIRYAFDSLVVSEGIKIQLVNQTSHDLLVNITGNSSQYLNQMFYLVNMHRGNVLFYQPVHVKEQNQLIKFESKMLKGGINQLILLDNKLRPVSERLVFSDKMDIKELNLKTAKDKHLRRSEVPLLISVSDSLSEKLNLSLSVIHEDLAPAVSSPQNILSWLLISSELKGYVEDPADFFSDSVLSAQAKQRLLMLTNGWSSYFWNSAPSAGTEIKYPQKAGIEIAGTAADGQSGEPLEQAEIAMVVNTDGEMAILEQITNDDGRFIYSGLLFYDTAIVLIQAKNPEKRQRSIIKLDPEEISPVSDSYLRAAANSTPGMVKTETRTLFSIESDIRRRTVRTRPPRPKQVMVKETGDGHYRLYEQADQVIEIPERVATSGNILDYLEGKVAGLDISGDQVVLRGASNISGSSSPMFLVDGIPLTEHRPIEEAIENEDNSFSDYVSSAVRKVKSIPIGDIEKVEILKNPQNLAVFGVDGANGVIAIYTRKGKNESDGMVKDVLEQRIKGFSVYRKFYAPEYVPGNRVMRANDIRGTLHWDPELLLEDSSDSVSFYTSDLLGKYSITVEGISESGEICYGRAWFEVVISD